MKKIFERKPVEDKSASYKTKFPFNLIENVKQKNIQSLFEANTKWLHISRQFWTPCFTPKAPKPYQNQSIFYNKKCFRPELLRLSAVANLKRCDSIRKIF